ncbi:MAG TPA: hypothetical protein VG777_09365 [Thermoanaerobaculia bacterium]|nr:hypothetical protein [Thermoanaerobaculia bacterium]
MLNGMDHRSRAPAPVHPLLHTATATAPLTFSSVRHAIGRGLRLRCPVCGVGRLFASFWTMREDCPQCGVRWAREAIWLGSMDINLTLSLLLILGSLVVLPDLGLVREMVVLGAAAVLLPALMFRWVRGVWVSLLYLSGGVY